MERQIYEMNKVLSVVSGQDDFIEIAEVLKESLRSDVVHSLEFSLVVEYHLVLDWALREDIFEHTQLEVEFLSVFDHESECFNDASLVVALENQILSKDFVLLGFFEIHVEVY